MDRYADIAYKSAQEDIIYQYEDDYQPQYQAGYPDYTGRVHRRLSGWFPRSF